MEHSGTEPSSVILSQTCSIKSWKVMTKTCLKTSWSQKGWCNKPTKLQFQWILKARKILMLSKRYESIEVDRICCWKTLFCWRLRIYFCALGIFCLFHLGNRYFHLLSGLVSMTIYFSIKFYLTIIDGKY